MRMRIIQNNNNVQRTNLQCGKKNPQQLTLWFFARTKKKFPKIKKLEKKQKNQFFGQASVAFTQLCKLILTGMLVVFNSNSFLSVIFLLLIVV